MSQETTHGSQEGVWTLIEKARNTGITGADPPGLPTIPLWLDRQAIRKGQKFARKHFFLIFFTHFVSLILLLSYIPVRTILIKTGRSCSQRLALIRYLSTLRHVKLWYESDMCHETSEVVRDILKIRQVHSGVSQKVRNGLDRSSGNEALRCSQREEQLMTTLRSMNDDNANLQIANSKKCLEINQLDMIVTQFCFMGLLTQFPGKFGIHTKEDLEGLHGFSHIWGLVGHLLGIEKEFNLCIGDKTTLKKAILEILLCDLRQTTNETVHLWNALVNAMSEFVPCLSIQSSLLYILEQTLDKNCNCLKNACSYYERFSYILTHFLFNTAFEVALFRMIFNGLLRLAIYLTSIRVMRTF